MKAYAITLVLTIVAVVVGGLITKKFMSGPTA